MELWFVELFCKYCRCTWVYCLSAHCAAPALALHNCLDTEIAQPSPRGPPHNSSQSRTPVTASLSCLFTVLSTLYSWSLHRIYCLDLWMTQLLSIVASPVGYSPVATPSHTTRRITVLTPLFRHKSRGRGSKRHVSRVRTLAQNREPLIRKSARDINFYTCFFYSVKKCSRF